MKINFSAIVEKLTGKSYDAWRQFCYYHEKEPSDIIFLKEYIKSDGSVVDRGYICAKVESVQMALLKGDNALALMRTKELIDDITQKKVLTSE